MPPQRWPAKGGKPMADCDSPARFFLRRKRFHVTIFSTSMPLSIPRIAVQRRKIPVAPRAAPAESLALMRICTARDGSQLFEVAPSR